MESGKLFVSLLAVLANLFLAAGKIIVGAISKSSAILADGINSGTDVIASTISFIGIKVAEKPADKEHPYGHGKAEVISGFVITLIIFLSGLWIIYEAIASFFLDVSLNLGTLGFGVMAVSAFVNGIMSQIKIWAGEKYDSVSLVSDGVHSRIDFLVSLGIFIGLFFTRYYSYIDSILALFVGLYILKESFELGKKSTDSLIGVSAGEEIEKKIRDEVKKENVEIEELKTQKLGHKIFAELSIKLPSNLKVSEAEKIIDKIENKLTSNGIDYVAIDVESYDVSSGYYQPSLGKGFGWKRSGKKKKSEGKGGLGPKGKCKCPECGKEVKHKRGIPCSKMKCPECGSELKRKQS